MRTARTNETTVSAIVVTAPSSKGGRNMRRSRISLSSIDVSVGDQVADAPAIEDALELTALLHLPQRAVDRVEQLLIAFVHGEADLPGIDRLVVLDALDAADAVCSDLVRD